MADSERYICPACGRFVQPPSQVTERSECSHGGSAGRMASIVPALVSGGQGGRRRASRAAVAPGVEQLDQLEEVARVLRDALAERNRLIVSLRRAGLSLRQIGAVADLTAPAVQYVLDKAGVVRDHAIPALEEAF
jgi:DNA-directed RNA polymerase specialized sigma subunit